MVYTLSSVVVTAAKDIKDFTQTLEGLKENIWISSNINKQRDRQFSFLENKHSLRMLYVLPSKVVD